MIHVANAYPVFEYFSGQSATAARPFAWPGATRSTPIKYELRHADR
jgi:hypothetical protein